MRLKLWDLIVRLYIYQVKLHIRKISSWLIENLNSEEPSLSLISQVKEHKCLMRKNYLYHQIFLETKTSKRYPEEPEQDAPKSICLRNTLRPRVFTWGLAVLYSTRSGLSSIFQPNRFNESMIAARKRLQIRSWHPSALAGSRALLEAPCCPLVAANDTGNTRTVFTLWWELD